MKSKVYFTAVKPSDDIPAINKKLQALLDTSGVLNFIRKKYKVAVKIHFGEDGTSGFVRPEHARVICDAIAAKGASSFLTDTNTLYRGKRLNSEDHLKVAYKHGFTKKATGVDVVIPGNTEKEMIEVEPGKRFIKKAKIARIFIDADAMVAINHFKGHVLTGFGGAIKNLGMGCATREGKLAQHCDVSPVVYTDKCTGCGECEIVCPTKAIAIKNKKSVIDISRCIGCASCMAACPTGAMFIDMKFGDKVQKKMAEYCLAALKGKKEKSGFINFAVKISKECDCWAMDTPRIAPDVGIFASLDPVSIDKASFDLVRKASGRDIFKEAHPDQDGMVQLEYAEEIGLGSMDYELIEA